MPRKTKLDLDDPVKVYLREVGTAPPLSVMEEALLIKRIAAAELAKHCLIEANLALVVPIARRFSGPDAHILDLIQVGNEGLLRAVNACRPQPGKRFAPYARKLIREAIQEHIGGRH